METRTRNLGILLLTTVLAVVVLFAASAWFDENTRLDSEFASLQSKAAKASATASVPSAPRHDQPSLRLRPKDKLPSLVAFAQQVKSQAALTGLVLENLSLKEQPGKDGMVSLQTTTTMTRWVAFQHGLETSAGPLVFRAAQFDLVEGSQYQIRSVIGYAVAP